MRLTHTLASTTYKLEFPPLLSNRVRGRYSRRPVRADLLGKLIHLSEDNLSFRLFRLPIVQRHYSRDRFPSVGHGHRFVVLADAAEDVAGPLFKFPYSYLQHHDLQVSPCRHICDHIIGIRSPNFHSFVGAEAYLTPQTRQIQSYSPSSREYGVVGGTVNGEQLKKTVRSGGVVYGTMLSMSRNPRWVTPISGFGLDYVIIDTEHAPRDRSDIADLLAAFTGSGVVPIVRIPIPDSHYVTMTLDAGAQGVLAPYCETVEEVQEVVGAAKWRPLKGELARKAVETGELPSEETKTYLEERNRSNVCIIGIESVPAIENLENILHVDGIDAIFVGPNDLTISLGIPDQVEHPEYEEALRRIIGACQEHDTPVLIHHQTVALTQKWLSEGARFVLYSSDARTMHNGFRDEFGAIKEVGERVTGKAAARVGESEEVI